MQQKTYTQQEFYNALLLHEIKYKIIEIDKFYIEIKLEKKLKNCLTK